MVVRVGFRWREGKVTIGSMSKMIRPERRARAVTLQTGRMKILDFIYEDPLAKVMEARTQRDVLVRIFVRQESTTRLRILTAFNGKRT